ncbi:MAG: serine O-acetyltransferase [Clostridia bacterium]|nr:serine O-acetyltransferase [Clostridia bacterium]
MNLKELKFLWYSDLYRYTGKTNKKLLVKNLLSNPGFKYTFYMRLCKYLKSKDSFIASKLAFKIFHIILRHYEYKFGIQIPYYTQIAGGFYIGHFGCIVVNGSAVIGSNCNISHGVTLGQSNRGKYKGYPTLGNNVYIGPGAKVIGGLNIGNNVAIGANSVVTKDIPDNAVVVGIPGKVISFEGSDGYVNRTDYEKIIC